MPRQRRPSQNWHWGPKLPQMQNLRGRFVVFFLGGQNRNFVKVRGLKLQLSLYFKTFYKIIMKTCPRSCCHVIKIDHMMGRGTKTKIK